MADSSAFILSSLLQSLDTLYPILFNLTAKAQEDSSDLDKQMVLDETRQGILNEALETINAAQNILKDLPPEADLDLDEIEKRLESLIWLLRQVTALDQQRSTALKEERDTLRQSLHHVHFGKQVVTTYQRSDLLKN